MKDSREKRKKKVPSLHERDYPYVSSIVHNIQTPENVSDSHVTDIIAAEEIIENPKAFPSIYHSNSWRTLGMVQKIV